MRKQIWHGWKHWKVLGSIFCCDCIDLVKNDFWIMKWVSVVRVSSSCPRVRVLDYLEAGVVTGVLPQFTLPPSCRRDKCYGMLTGWFISEVLILNILYRWEHVVKWIGPYKAWCCVEECAEVSERAQWTKSARSCKFMSECNFKICWLACFVMYLIWRKMWVEKSSTFLHFLLLMLLLAFISW